MNIRIDMKELRALGLPAANDDDDYNHHYCYHHPPPRQSDALKKCASNSKYGGCDSIDQPPVLAPGLMHDGIVRDAEDNGGDDGDSGGGGHNGSGYCYSCGCSSINNSSTRIGGKSGSRSKEERWRWLVITGLAVWAAVASLATVFLLLRPAASSTRSFNNSSGSSNRSEDV